MPDENVIDVSEKMPHLAVPVRCLACKHKWVAVAPLGTDTNALACPECGAQRTIHQR